LQGSIQPGELRANVFNVKPLSLYIPGMCLFSPATSSLDDC